MLILVCRPRSQPRSAARNVCFSPAARALVGLPCRRVCLFWSAARARSRAPPPGMFASALPPARSWVCRAAGYAYFGLPPALAAALRRPECLLQPCRPRARGFAVPPGMLILVCRPRSQPRSAARNVCFSPAARALVGLPCRRVCLFWSAARARSRAPPPGMFASALPPARSWVCRAAGYAYFGLPPALAAALRRPECLLQPCRPRACGFAELPGMLISAPPRRPVCLFWSAARARSRAPPPGMFASALPPARLRVCRAARYAYFGPAAPPGGARKHPGSWPLITPAACRKA